MIKFVPRLSFMQFAGLEKFSVFPSLDSQLARRFPTQERIQDRKVPFVSKIVTVHSRVILAFLIGDGNDIDSLLSSFTEGYR